MDIKYLCNNINNNFTIININNLPLLLYTMYKYNKKLLSHSMSFIFCNWDYINDHKQILIFEALSKNYTWKNLSII